MTLPEAFQIALQRHQSGQLEDAEALYRQILAAQPNHPQALHLLGLIAHQVGRHDAAVECIRQATLADPMNPIAHSDLGVACYTMGQLGEAVTAFHRALELKPDYPEALTYLGAALAALGQFDEAVDACRRALELSPSSPDAHINLGIALKNRGELDESIAAFQRALQLKPDSPEALNNLGNALKDRGELDESIAAYRRAVQLKPNYVSAHSNLVHTLRYHPGYDAAAISEEQERWNRQFCEPLKQFQQPHTNNRQPGKRLRIGYVSPDFRDHPVGRHVLPLLERHDREQFEILCYSGVAQPDWMTERLRALTAPARNASRSDAGGQWRTTVGVSDDELARMIREDGVDILVDLAMHTSGNRLPLFARQPAPMQVSWLGYPGSTGLPCIAYRLTDSRMEPPGSRGRGTAESSEEPMRLPDSWCCYEPVNDSAEINALPASSAEGVTFGSLNNFAKVNDGVLALWARMLAAVKGSRLLMSCPEGAARKRVRTFFSARGLAAERVECVGILPRSDYLQLYHRIDLGLDPFPCNGMTTTCDALWMGVPVLTLPGATPVSRAGLSLLSSLGLGELAASSEEDYLRIALELAANLPRLAQLRATLRPRMQASPLMDAPRFARNVEAAYRKMWERWRLGNSPARDE